ncbi:MAG: hypothetical protein J6S29_05395 [Methanosphaera sp.]|nr:hypothetical protein [Methanosphaera sp.]
MDIPNLIQRRRLQVLVHSCIYYEFNQNIVSDRQWDMWARELVELQNQYPEESKKVIWYEAFKDWDASTGAFLPITDRWVLHKAQYIMKLCGISFDRNKILKSKQSLSKTIRKKLF